MRALTIIMALILLVLLWPVWVPLLGALTLAGGVAAIVSPGALGVVAILVIAAMSLRDGSKRRTRTVARREAREIARQQALGRADALREIKMRDGAAAQAAESANATSERVNIGAALSDPSPFPPSLRPARTTRVAILVLGAALLLTAIAAAVNHNRPASATDATATDTPAFVQQVPLQSAAALAPPGCPCRNPTYAGAGDANDPRNWRVTWADGSVHLMAERPPNRTDEQLRETARKVSAASDYGTSGLAQNLIRVWGVSPD
jgi:hypothetical protein